MPPIINLLVEGTIDDMVGRRLIEEVGSTPGVTFGKQGHAYVRRKVQAFDRTSRGVPLLILVDHMDTNEDCPPAVVENWLPYRLPTTLLRVAVQEIESWLLADVAGLSSFFHVRAATVPLLPDQVPDPKRTLIDLARSSSSRRMRDGVVPTSDGASTGPLYNALCVDFVVNHWDPVAAARSSPSLARARDALRGFVAAL